MKITLIFRSMLDPRGGPNEQVFVEAHDEAGRSIDVGEWAADGEYETLTIDCDKFATEAKAARNAVIEECAKLIEPKQPRPCDCERCDCHNQGDAEAVSSWDTDAYNAKIIRALEPTSR